MASRVTLQDVARHAGVSRTTASFVLTGRRDMRISVDAEQRVLRAARELSYRPNLMARGLRTRTTHTIGLISDTVTTEPFAGDIVRGAVNAALRHDNLLVIGETSGDRGVEERVVQDMLDRGVDGFLYASTWTRVSRLPAVLRGHPFVWLNCLPRGRASASAVIPDERSAGTLAASALTAVGHERIALVGVPSPDVWAAGERLAGIRAAGVTVAATVECDWWPEPAYTAVSSFLATGPSVTGLICLNDRIALGAYQAAQEAGLRVPDDLSVVSFDDSDLAAWLRPSLTSVALPHAELGGRAVDLLLSPPASPLVERVPMRLHERASIAPPSS
ncbi:alanine racemase [Asanoa ishikariensis]|uniref:Transcriptional regulator, LacI family n=1 Tax=Asanoa ishikariensis TaxID=137265 RepID=A0A1H3UQT2_9ACTN|nr:LacI family DNA-binding transcriptional regulator [Asanoa ishikariensis]GIF69131.1 alanine racemase [Asanoa ishikariensis]SDZ64245.1 transcriptional regulator, LacI family [Asanoa ishikariensis]